MGDTHFIIRHGLTGFVFLAFMMFGLLPAIDASLLLDRMSGLGPLGADDKLAKRVATLAGMSFFDVTSALVALFLTTPVLGVMIQGIHVALMYSKPVAWADPARIEVARHIRDSVRTADLLQRLEPRTRKRYPELLDSIRPDSLFVWLYYSQAPEHMVEWARRRRSYHYLGQNWILAAGLGLICGVAAPSVYAWPLAQKIALFAVVSLAWAGGTHWISREMKRDVDDMEFVWAMSRLHPQAFRSLLPETAPAHEKGGGAAGIVLTPPEGIVTSDPSPRVW